MKITNVTGKTATLIREPGERLGIDKAGYCLNWITVRFAGDTDLRDRAVASIRDLHAAITRDDLKEQRADLIEDLLDQPLYRSQKVFVGCDY